MDSLNRFAERKLAAIERRSLRRELGVVERVDARRVRRGGRELVSFASNDYLGLSHDPGVVAASVEAVRRFGVGAGASRLIEGNHPLYAALEQRLAALKGTDAAIVFGSGYLTNVGVLPLFAGAADLVVIDELCHSCLLAGAELSGAAVRSFAHNDVAAARALLERERADARHCLVVTDGVFSMEGELAPLPELGALAREFDAWLLADDAHGLGVVGSGRGSTFAHAAPADVPLQMGTLSKAVGAYGGYLCADAPVVELVANRARSFVYSTGLPPGTVAAATAALDVIATDTARTSRPLALARRFTETLGLPGAGSPIVAWPCPTPARALAASRALAEAGFFAPAIRPPTVPPGTACVRLAFSAVHTDDDAARLAEAVAELERAA